MSISPHPTDGGSRCRLLVSRVRLSSTPAVSSAKPCSGRKGFTQPETSCYPPPATRPTGTHCANAALLRAALAQPRPLVLTHRLPNPSSGAYAPNTPYGGLPVTEGVGDTGSGTDAGASATTSPARPRSAPVPRRRRRSERLRCPLRRDRATGLWP